MPTNAIDNRLENVLSYDIFWLLIGLALLFVGISSIIFILCLTQKEKVRSTKELVKLKDKGPDLAEIRKKYLKILDEIEQEYQAGKLSNSESIQGLSISVRLFYCESMGFHAEFLTLSDIKRTNYRSLAKLIEQYYPDEFDTLEMGEVAEASAKARALIMEHVA